MDREKIANLRKSLKLAQTKFWQLVGAHGMTVSKLERGRSPHPWLGCVDSDRGEA